MFFCKRNVHLLTSSLCVRHLAVNPCTSLGTARSYTSSCSNGKGHNNDKKATTADDEEDTQEPFVANQSPPTQAPTPPSTRLNLSFMPVINIPQTEFAHNAFFSLHRPLLGLADQDEKPFFSNMPVEEQEDVDEQIANYMMNVKAFEPPMPPGTQDQQAEEENDKYTTVTFSTGDSMLPDDEVYMESTLPMFYMPDSDDIVEYLSTMQERLVRQNALEDAISTTKNSNNNSSVGRTRRTNNRFKASSSPSSSSSSPSSPSSTSSTSSSSLPASSHRSSKTRCQQYGLYRHRWNKN